MKNLNLGTILIIAVASAIPDLAFLALKYASQNMVLHYSIRDWVKFALSYRYWSGLLFGVFYASTLSVVLRERARIGFNEIVGMGLVCPLVQIILPIAFGFAGPMLSGIFLGPYTDILFSFTYALLIALIVRSGLQVELGGGEIFTVGFVGALIVAANHLPKLPFYPEAAWYCLIGTSIGIFASRMSYRDYGLRLD